jgi:hypothetical protein
VVGLITPVMVESTGWGAYAFFAFFCLLSLLWVYWFVPETMGKSLEEMDHVFKDVRGAGEEERKKQIDLVIAARMGYN